MTLGERKQVHERFWRGEGPSLILIPPPEPPETSGYLDRFADARLMWEHEVRLARAAMDWPTDGIPTVRPNLGVVFIPSLVGQTYRLVEGHFPWPGDPLSEDAIRAIPNVDITTPELMERARTFYALHAESGETGIAPYPPDNQGVFDNAQMLYGEDILCDVIDLARQEWLCELMDICVDLYVRVTRYVKDLIHEDNGSMIHGHGTPQGVYFPHAGARISEDTAILLSPSTIEEIIMPYVERAATAFGGVFFHYCGRHDALFEQLCRSPYIRAIDVQPGMHDLQWMLERCAESNTVLYSGVAARNGEDWRTYTERVGGLVRQTGARCIVRPGVFPSTRDECAAMRDRWRKLTG